ncbi:MAG: hypothetical protein JWN63_2821 [Candidatus Acidoferrum typicum]|nr:hypothetical protein [Candidatus Acidoferrum typicum]
MQEGQRVKVACDELRAVIQWIDAHSSTVNYPPTLGPMIAGGCLDMAIEHQASVAVLAEQQLYGSAHTLLRSAIEAYVRGVWFWRCASEKEIRHFQTTDGVEKGFGTLVEEVERKLGNGATALSRMKTLHWKALCSFTHTGYQQVARRYADGMLKPNYLEDDVVKALSFASAAGLLAAAELAALSNDRDAELGVLERMKQYVATRPTR